MKKKIISVVLAIVVSATLCISASAYSNNITPGYGRDVDRYYFSNTIHSSCTQLIFLKHLDVAFQVSNASNEAYICGSYNYANTPNITSNSLVASASMRTIPYGTYAYDGFGTVNYIDQLNADDETCYDHLTLTISSGGITASTAIGAPSISATSRANAFAERGREIAKSFDINTSEYTCILSSDFAKYINSVKEYFSISDSIALAFGDTMPVYFLSTDCNSLLAVKQDSSAINYLYTFQKDDNNSWTLSKAADTCQSNVLYLQSFLDEVNALDVK